MPLKIALLITNKIGHVTPELSSSRIDINGTGGFSNTTI